MFEYASFFAFYFRKLSVTCQQAESVRSFHWDMEHGAWVVFVIACHQLGGGQSDQTNVGLSACA